MQRFATRGGANGSGRKPVVRGSSRASGIRLLRANGYKSTNNVQLPFYKLDMRGKSWCKTCVEQKYCVLAGEGKMSSTFDTVIVVTVICGLLMVVGGMVLL